MNYVGEAIVMVVATNRYVAEDAASRIRVDYEFLPAVVGVEAARAAEHLVHEDVPGNVAAVMVQETGDADAAIDRAPHVLELDLAIERSASMPMEGKGVLARWDADDRSLLVHTSTQSSTSVRQAIAAKPRCPWTASRWSPPTSAAASGSRSCTPGRRRCWCPGPRSGSARR